MNDSYSSYIFFGRKPIIECFNSGRKLDKIWLLKDAAGEEMNTIRQLAHEASVPVQRVPREKLERLLKTNKLSGNHQGVVAMAAMVEYFSIEEALRKVFEAGENPLFVAIDNVTDIMNLGAIARSAECFGAQAIIMEESGSALINAQAMKSSAGALNHLIVCRVRNMSVAMKTLKANGVKIIATDMRGSADLGDVDFSEPTALLMGSEGQGVHPSLLKLCDAVLSIKMVGATESLNVSVSAGIILHHAMTQRTMQTL
jgi:23S rRNA (guanosine2251-2'-O)-methyltransferase